MPYIEASHKQRSIAAKRRPTTRSDQATTAQVRDWAVEQGIRVNDRSRVSDKVMAQYHAAH
ncbi:Lsr2 family DNA-binding protein [Arthrobacter sp. ZGTC412]|uniref:Lsr2 family DNA-binding protein n=1 Tax=Arthrobacter sp. ZGTC412 TaxID=2058900 RepID=UPI000CE369FD